MNWTSVALRFGAKQCDLLFRDAKSEMSIPVGLADWLESMTELPTAPLKLTGTYGKDGIPTRLAAAGAWTDPNTFTIALRFVETAHYDTLTCRFEGEGVQLQFRSSLSILNNAKDKRPPLTGKRIA